MRDIKNYLNEFAKPDNCKEYQVYVNGKLDKTFTENSKKWKKKPKVGQGWYAGGTVFKIVKIEDDKVYAEEDKECKP
jgi:hypothetical protein